jgi:tRNA threonylcarbamoyl adenosine modification protein (Sua5/YciO/YrdC/YwlC family)
MKTPVFVVHPDNPQPRHLAAVAKVLQDGGLIIYPTDSCYALGCLINAKQASDRIHLLRQLPKEKELSIVFKDLSQLAQFAILDNSAFRLLKRYTPGPFTFLLPAGADMPKRLLESKRKVIGARISAQPVVQGLLALVSEPLLTSSLIPPGETLPLTDMEVIKERFGKQVDALLLSGDGAPEETTLVDLQHGQVEILRQGIGIIQ